MSKETQLTVKDRTLSQVQVRIAEIEKGGFKLPKNYSAENALQSAWLMLQETKTRDKRPVLEACDKNSIAMSLFKMVQLGLNPAKKQCYFIPYGNSLQLMTSYFGNVALAKRTGLQDVKANVIRKGDTFEFETKTDGRKEVKVHVQPFENLDNEIIGAYCITVDANATIDTDIMTIKEIKASWQQSMTKGNSAVHKNFESEMAKRTVINRATKMYVNSSDDAYLFIDDEPSETPTEAYVENQIKEKANKTEINFEKYLDAEDLVVEEDKPQEDINVDHPTEGEEDVPEWAN